MSRFKRSIMALLAIATMLTPSVAQAQDTGQRGGSGLSITPTRFEYVIERGNAETITLQVKNLTTSDVLAKAVVNDFEADGLTGNPKIITDPKEQSPNSLIKYVLGVEDITIKAGQTADVQLVVQIPQDAPPGAYFGAIRYTGTAADPDGTEDQAQLALNASVAALLLVEVPGDVKEQIQLEKITALKDDKEGSFFTSKPNFVGVQIKNLGNGFAKPFGKVQVSNPLGKEVHTYELNNTNPRGNVLPDASRLFKDELKGVSLPGRYKITANISYGRGGEILNLESTFWYLPVWFIASILGVIALIVLLAFVMYRRYISQPITKRKHR